MTLSAKRSSPSESAEALRRVTQLARQWLPEYSTTENTAGSAKLNLYFAQALQNLSEAGDLSDLNECEKAYNHAIAGLSASNDPDGLLDDARSGLAAVLQVRGEVEGDAEKLRRAVTLHRELVDSSRSVGGSQEEAGPLENLAGSLMSLAAVANRGEAESLYGEAKTALERVLQIHQRRSDADRGLLAREHLDNIERALAEIRADVPLDTTTP